jgi:hypothetical protein
VGPIAGHRINAQIKLALLTVIETSQDSGVSTRRSCSLLMIAFRRVVRWQGYLRSGLGLVDGTPGPREALHRLLPEEVASITRLACRPEYADLSHRILAVTIWEKGWCFASFSTVYRVLKAHGLMTARGHSGTHNGHSLAPVRKTLTGASDSSNNGEELDRECSFTRIAGRRWGLPAARGARGANRPRARSLELAARWPQ